MFLTMEGQCIREEIYTYFGRSTDAPSKTALYKQMQKLKVIIGCITPVTNVDNRTAATCGIDHLAEGAVFIAFPRP